MNTPGVVDSHIYFFIYIICTKLYAKRKDLALFPSPPPTIIFLQSFDIYTVHSVYSSHVVRGHSDKVATLL